MCLCSEESCQLSDNQSRSEGEGTRKYSDRVELLCERKKREGWSSCDSIQDEEQLCESELCFLFYIEASVKTCSTFENIKVFCCEIFLGSSDFVDVSLTLPLILFTFYFLVKNSWRYLSDYLWAHDAAKVPFWSWVADRWDFTLRYWWRKYSDTVLRYKCNYIEMGMLWQHVCTSLFTSEYTDRFTSMQLFVLLYSIYQRRQYLINSKHVFHHILFSQLSQTKKRRRWFHFGFNGQS